MADSLAKLGLSWMLSLQILKKPPTEVLGYIQKDMDNDFDTFLN